MKIVLISCLAALIPMLLLNIIPAATLGQSVIPFGFSVLFIVIIPVGMGYAVVTQKLLDIDIIIRRSAVYGLITVLMAAILSAAIIPILALKNSIGIAQQIL